MNFFFIYLIKFSISIAAVWLFYQLVLRKLTFHNWNRWYLVGYTALSFFLAATNITPLLKWKELENNETVRLVPLLNLEGKEIVITGQPAIVNTSWTAMQWMLFICVVGTIILLLRFFLQYLSFLRIRSQAQLVSDDGMKLYQVNSDIMPFSFGNAIFINQQLHTEDELKDIIRHAHSHPTAIVKRVSNE